MKDAQINYAGWKKTKKRTSEVFCLYKTLENSKCSTLAESILQLSENGEGA